MVVSSYRALVSVAAVFVYRDLWLLTLADGTMLMVPGPLVSYARSQRCSQRASWGSLHRPVPSVRRDGGKKHESDAHRPALKMVVSLSFVMGMELLSDAHGALGNRAMALDALQAQISSFRLSVQGIGTSERPLLAYSTWVARDSLMAQGGRVP